MNKIKLHLLAKHEWGNDYYYFTDAGDIKIETSGDRLHIKNVEGEILFGAAVHCVIVFGFTDVDNPNKLFFDLSHKLWSNAKLLCFDPRIIMTSILVDILGAVKINNWKKKIKKIEKAINPVPTIEEATEFLKRNKLYKDPHSFDQEFNPRINYPEDLVGIPEKVQALFEQNN